MDEICTLGDTFSYYPFCLNATYLFILKEYKYVVLEVWDFLGKYLETDIHICSLHISTRLQYISPVKILRFKSLPRLLTLSVSK